MLHALWSKDRKQKFSIHMLKVYEYKRQYYQLLVGESGVRWANVYLFCPVGKEKRDWSQITTTTFTSGCLLSITQKVMHLSQRVMKIWDSETAGVQQPVAEGAAQWGRGVLEWVGHIVQQGGQLGCHSPVSHHLHSVQRTPQDRAGLLNQAVQALPAPADHTKKDGWCALVIGQLLRDVPPLSILCTMCWRASQ